MYDWNNDGKNNYKDDAFLYKVVEKGSEKESTTKCKVNASSGSSYSSSSSKGLGWFIVLCVVYLFIELIGG